MRLSKVNLIRKANRGNSLAKSRDKSLRSSEKQIIGAFWYIKDELDDEQARILARTKQVDGYRGDIFYGSAENLWKKTFAKRLVGSNSIVHSQNANRSPSLQNEAFSGRSYGLLSDDDEDDIDEELQNFFPSSFPRADISSENSFSRTYFPSPTQQDLLSPPLSPKISQSKLENSTPERVRHSRDEHTPPMPGSFIFEDEAPASPAFSASITEPIHTISDILYLTPARPFYINPGLALEGRFDSTSPIPLHSRFDMTPRQLAAFSRRRQDIEKLLERPSTPYLASDTGIDDMELSDKEKAERERRRKDLLKFRLERQRRLRLENSGVTDPEADASKKRGREIFEEMDMEADLGESAPKKSRSSEIFARALGVEKLQDDPSGDSQVTNMDAEVDDKARSPAYSDSAIPFSAEDVEKSPVSTAVEPSNSYSAPTPSPSPPLRPGNAPKNQLHQPKIPSNLRNTTNFTSSPATSPLKRHQLENIGMLNDLSQEPDKQARVAVDMIPKSSYLKFDFPPLRPSFVTNISPSVLTELAKYF